MISRKSTAVIFIALQSYVSATSAYDPLTHRAITEHSSRASNLNTAENTTLAKFGLGSNVDDKKHLLPNSRGNTLTVRRLMQDGAEYEDDGRRPLNHFFDPQNEGRGLTIIGEIGHPSPLWSLEDLLDIDKQQFSYRDAQDYLYSGLTAQFAKERQKNLGLAIESLGHVIHHIQDMAQPQHVRDDDHCDKYRCVVLYKPSAYESYTRDRSWSLPFGGYAVVHYGTFDTPRKFWENGGKGIAEFTSRNFVSIGTNLETRGGHIFPHEEYPSPSGGQAFIDKRQITDPDLLGPQGPDQPLSGEIWFIGTPVKDYYAGTETLNTRTSTYSIFDSDLEEAGQEQIFTLNRFNYDSAHEFLLPRAAAYSAGLINYFFRGDIEISLPERGVYGVVDHAQTSAGEGFTKLRLALRNATPDGGGVPQEMPGGTLLAVAKYVRNPCYEDDLSGEFGGVIDYFNGTITPSGCPIAAYLGGQEQISVSAPIVAASLERGGATEIEFDFGHAPIPIDSRDIVLQVVYSGMLGEEMDAVVVGAKNISEPTYLAYFNNSDYFQLDGQLYKPEEIRSDPALTSRVDFDNDGDVDDKDINIDPEPLHNLRIAIGDHYLTEPVTLDPLNYIRIAVLTDPDELIPVRTSANFASSYGSNNTYNAAPLETQLSREPYVLSAIDKTRGIHFWFMVFGIKFFGPGTPPADVLKTLEPVSSDPGPTPVTLVSP